MTHSILTIEHSPSNKQRILDWLTPTGMNLTVVDSYSAALQVLDYEHPHVILFSSRLPEVSANNLIKQLKVSAPLAELIVIVKATDPALRNPEIVGYVNDFLIEPLHQEELLFNVYQSLKTYRIHQENNYLKEELSFATLLLNWQP